MHMKYVLKRGLIHEGQVLNIGDTVEITDKDQIARLVAKGTISEGGKASEEATPEASPKVDEAPAAESEQADEPQKGQPTPEQVEEAVSETSGTDSSVESNEPEEIEIG